MQSKIGTVKRQLTIMDVAKKAGVSKSTVSLVLQGSSLVREKTATQVREAARKLGYVYNRRAAELRSSSSKTIGVVIDDLMNPFFAELLVGIERMLVDAGYTVLMAHTQEDLGRQRNVLLSMREQNAAGIIICPALRTPHALAKEIQSWGIPLVVLVRSLGRGSYDYAGSNNRRGTLLATKHLLDAGHRRIAFLGGSNGVVYKQRIEGYVNALSAASIDIDKRLIIESSLTRQGGQEAMNTALRIVPRPTAAVCYNDVTAFGALVALGEHSLRAGKDFALLGFDNVLDAAHSNPPLSTVDVHPGALGEQAAKLLIERITNPKQKRQVFVAEPSLFLRQSG